MDALVRACTCIPTAVRSLSRPVVTRAPKAPWRNLFGARESVELLGLGVFGAGSPAGSRATSSEQLIAARVVMGLGAAAIFPSTLSLISSVFTERKERSKAIGLWRTAATPLGPCIEVPLVGGAPVAAAASTRGEPCITAEFSAPSAGPSPWYLYRVTADQVYAFGTAEPYGATRFSF